MRSGVLLKNTELTQVPKVLSAFISVPSMFVTTARGNSGREGSAQQIHLGRVGQLLIQLVCLPRS